MATILRALAFLCYALNAILALGLAYNFIQSIIKWDWLLIPLKVVSDSDLIPVAGSEVKPGVFGAKRRWRSYSA